MDLRFHYMAFKKHALKQILVFLYDLSSKTPCVELRINVSRDCDQIRQTFPDLFAIEERSVSTLLGGC